MMTAEHRDDVCIGVDGCRDGWIAAAITVSGRTLEWSFHPRIGEVFRAWPDAWIGIDIPIGLPSGTLSQRRRQCDLQAAAFLGRARSSIFMTPPRSIVELYSPEASHAQVSTAAKERFGYGISIQTWHILAKVAETDDALAEIGPDRRARVVEVHPECSFHTMASIARPTAAARDDRRRFDSKKTARGAGQRLAALSVWFDLPELAGAPARAAVDDVLDAAAVAWSTRRRALGQAELMPAPAQFDERGLAMQISR
jgi:predicted RNase H-like nuclease